MSLTFDLVFLPIGFHNKLLPVFPKGLVYSNFILISNILYMYFFILKC